VVERRRQGYELTRLGMARLRSGDESAARRALIAALAIDPGARGAVATLRRTSPPLPTDAPPPTLLARLEIGQRCAVHGAGGRRSGTPYLPLRSILVMDLEQSNADVQRLGSAQERDDRFWSTLTGLLERYYGLPVEDDVPSGGINAQERYADVTVRVRDEHTVVRIEATGTVALREPHVLWPWKITPDRRDLAIGFVSAKPPPGTKRRVEVTTCGWAFTRATPAPAAAQGSDRKWTLAWALAGGSSGSGPSVTLDIPLLDEVALDGTRATPGLRVLLALFLPFLIALLALAALRGLKNPIGRERTIVVTFIVGIVLLAGTCCSCTRVTMASPFASPPVSYRLPCWPPSMPWSPARRRSARGSCASSSWPSPSLQPSGSRWPVASARRPTRWMRRWWPPRSF
jgi:hypothetical protein